MVSSTQVQVTKFKEEGGKQYFVASCVADLGFTMKNEFRPITVENRLIALKHAHPESIKHADEEIKYSNAKLDKIYMSFIKNGNRPDDALVSALLKAVCGTTEEDYIINTIKENENYCHAFGIDYAKSEDEKIKDIKKIMNNASSDDKPPFE